VGALFLVTLFIHHEFVILSDFDTDLDDMENMTDLTGVLRANPDLMGCYFRMIPYEGTGNVFQFQQMEYSLLRSLYRFHNKEQSVTVMPGAGSCYKRDVLISIYNEHSGFRSGEDREATQIGHRLGYKAVYAHNILTLTRPPLSFRALVKQRVRWNFGYLETFIKEWDHYGKQMSRFTRIGIRVIIDILVVAALVFLPWMLLSVLVFNPRVFLSIAGILYVASLIWCLNLILIAPAETDELKGKRLYLTLFYPVIKLAVDYFGWMGAFIRLAKKMRVQHQARKVFISRQSTA
jgi:cellulose synthase/poly-beta-1,6-N-acetylglucosamine synthase-like glycosyltransferase